MRSGETLLCWKGYLELVKGLKNICLARSIMNWKCSCCPLLAHCVHCVSHCLFLLAVLRVPPGPGIHGPFCKCWGSNLGSWAFCLWAVSSALDKIWDGLPAMPLKLTASLMTRKARQSSRLGLPSAGITGMCHHSWPPVMFVKINWNKELTGISGGGGHEEEECETCRTSWAPFVKKYANLGL